jgi:hypothetical protein
VTQTEQATTGKAAAAAAAKAMLQARIALVTTLGDAIDDHRRAGDAVAAARTAHDTAAEAARAAHANAIDGGWTATELRNAGLIVPASPRRKRSTTVSDGTAAGDGSGDH